MKLSQTTSIVASLQGTTKQKQQLYFLTIFLCTIAMKLL